MQTFLPYVSYSMSARILHRKHLIRSIIHARKIYDYLTGNYKSKRIEESEVMLMWKPYPYALSLYHDKLVQEFNYRGLKSKRYSGGFKPINAKPPATGNCWTRPKWLLNTDAELFCMWQRRMLTRLRPDYYKKVKVDGKFEFESCRVKKNYPIQPETMRDYYDDRWFAQYFKNRKKNQKQEKKSISIKRTKNRITKRGQSLAKKRNCRASKKP
jgi:hypothetical protein